MRLGDLLRNQGVTIPNHPVIPAPPEDLVWRLKERCFKLWLGVSFEGTQDRFNPGTMPLLTDHERKWLNFLPDYSILVEWYVQFLNHGRRGALQPLENEFEKENKYITHPSAEWSHRGGARPAWGSKVQTCFRRKQKQEGDAYANPDDPSPGQRNSDPFLNIRRK